MLLADNLKLPVEFVTETAVIFGKRGSGKSSTGARLAEQLAAASLPFAVLDVPDAWWGMKSSGDGKSPGLPVYVFGGRHADLPLESGAGAMLADVIVDHRINVVMSLRHFSNRERTQFVADFAERLFQRNTSPLHLFCEEAHRLMPQDVRDYERNSTPELMLGRMLKLHTEGRTAGIGLTCITQRPALLHKTATTQSEILIAHRILGPQDTEAIRGWIKHQDLDDQAGVMETLPTLKTGECWLWSPAWPDDKAIGLKRIKVLMPETYDSRRTPKPGENLREPKALAPVDIDRLRDKMVATIERAKAEDPKQLRKRIVELERDLKLEGENRKTVERRNEDLATRLKEKPKHVEERAELKRLRAAVREVGKFSQKILATQFAPEPVDRAALTAAIEKAVIAVCSAVSSKIERDVAHFGWIKLLAADIQEQLKAILAAVPEELVSERVPVGGAYERGDHLQTHGRREVQRPIEQQVERQMREGMIELDRHINQDLAGVHAPTSGSQSSTDGNLTRVAQRIVDAIAELNSLGIKQPPRAQVALMANYTHTGSTGFVKAVGGLSSGGLVRYPGPGLIELTDAGRAAAQWGVGPISEKELQQRLMSTLGGVAARILKPLIARNKEPMTRQELCEASGYTHIGSTGFVKGVGRLSSLGLVDYPEKGMVAATKMLFLE